MPLLVVEVKHFNTQKRRDNTFFDKTTFYLQNDDIN